MIFDNLGTGMRGKVASSQAKSTLISVFNWKVEGQVLYSNAFTVVCMIASPVLAVKTIVSKVM